MNNKHSNNQDNKTPLPINLGFFLIIIITIMIASTPNMKTNIFYSQSIERITNSETFTKVFLFMLGEEIPQFKSSYINESELPSLTYLALETVTGIKTNNISTLLMQEIPGSTNADTEIHLAGEGSDYSNMPKESPPPDFDELLKEQDPNKKELVESNIDDTDSTDISSNNPQNPTVFIYHSHSWEGYLPLIDEDVKPSDSSSVDKNENVVLVGSMLNEKFKEYGISAVHNQTNVAEALRHNGWDYRNSYTLSREYVETAASQNANMQYYIDIHRDSARKNSTTANEKDYAKLYFVVGREHENYEENLKFASEMHENLEKKYPGLSRGVYLKTKAEGNGVYNQDISNKSILIEFGGVDNDKKELSNTVTAFADVFKGLYEGVTEVNAQ